MINVEIKVYLIREYISIEGQHTDNFSPLFMLHIKI